MYEVKEVGYSWSVPAGLLLDRRDGCFPSWVVAQYFGELELHIDQVQMAESTNTLIVLPPRVPHWYVCHAPMTHNWLHIDGDLQPLLDRYNLRPGRLYPLMEMGGISELFHAISRSCYGNDAYRAEHMRLKAQELLLNVAMQVNLPQEVKEIGYTRTSMLRELRSEIMEHPDEDWTVHRMAGRLYLSESYFFQIYRQCFGVSPAHDVNLIRVERARTMLSDGMPVSYVSERCGYASVYSFIRSFKRVTGMTPGQYSRS